MIKIENLSHSFGEKVIFKDYSIEIPTGIHALVGKSGSGKTTLLRIISGLEKQNCGKISVPSPVSVAFQENRLLPWYSAKKNISIVSNEQTAEEILIELGLQRDLNSMPAELSGGMKRRVSLGRALVAESETLLLDEPFAGLDDSTALKTLETIKKYAENKTVIISTHNIEIANLLDSTIEIPQI